MPFAAAALCRVHVTPLSAAVISAAMTVIHAQQPWIAAWARARCGYSGCLRIALAAAAIVSTSAIAAAAISTASVAAAAIVTSSILPAASLLPRAAG
eukprot:scaffold124194_cov90-Phaeocystis_antarctica.AAC.1